MDEAVDRLIRRRCPYCGASLVYDAESFSYSCPWENCRLIAVTEEYIINLREENPCDQLHSRPDGLHECTKADPPCFWCERDPWCKALTDCTKVRFGRPRR